MTNKGTAKERNHWGQRFVLTALVYVSGIVAFSVWSYLEHQSIVAAQHAAGSAEPVDQQINKIALIEAAEFLFLVVVSIPLMVLYRRAGARNQHQAKELDAKLQRDNEKLKAHEKELEDAIQDLERFNDVATGRELRILELKNEVNLLLQEMDRPLRYATTTPAGEQSGNNDG